MIQIGQHFIGGFDGTQITPAVKKLIQKHQIGGLILFSRNIESPRQIRELVSKLQKLARKPLLISVDQEGGRVARMKAPFTIIPPMAVVGKYYRKTGRVKPIVELGSLMGRELRAVGYNWDFAPVVDVHSNPKNPIIGNRSFSPDPLVVSRCAGALIQGLHAEGVLSCVKHFPGHGATSVDSHLDLPILKADGRLLWKRDLLPYRKLTSRGLIATLMTAHVRYPALDPENCATLSQPILTDLLRGRIKYKGLIVSDDLFMKAISDRFGIADATLKFFRAGGDVALICKEPEVQMEAITCVAERLKKEKTLQYQLKRSSRRIIKLKQKFCHPQHPLPPLEILGCPQHQEFIKDHFGSY